MLGFFDNFDQAKDLIKQHEGLELKPYKDSRGFLTVGYGRCLDTKPLKMHEAEYLFDSDFKDALQLCKKNFKFFNKLNPARQAVLIDMCFNLGIAGLKKFITTLNHIERGEYKEAADSMLQSLWADQVKTRALTLSNMMRSGEFKK